MILRRITGHIKEQNWFAVGVDFLIVVIGILLAFQITEWAGARSDRAREEQMIRDLLTDLDIDRREYATAITAGEYRIGAANLSLVAAGLSPIEFDLQQLNTELARYEFEMPALASFPADRLDSLWSDVVIGYHPNPSTSTYDTMVGAGDFRIIRDRSVVREIQVYHTSAQAVIEQNGKLLSLRENLMWIGASSGLAPYLETSADEYSRLVAGNKELAAAIRILAVFAIYHIGDVKVADERAAQLQIRLEEFLGH